MEKRRITAIEIYNILHDEFKITQQVGNIEITLGGISAKYNGKDAIGDLLQEWLKEWFLHKDFYFRNHLNTQQFPDFLLSDSKSNGFPIKIKWQGKPGLLL